MEKTIVLLRGINVGGNRKLPMAELRGAAIWIDFDQGVRDTRLSPAVFDKAAGSTVTMRNWRTVRKLAERASG